MIQKPFRSKKNEASGTGSTFVLKDSTRAWIVSSGEVDIFAVMMRDGHMSGKRYHMFRAHKGEVLLGIDYPDENNGAVLIAASLPDSTIKGSPAARFMEARSDLKHNRIICSTIDLWIDGLSFGASKTEKEPGDCKRLEPGMTFPGSENLRYRVCGNDVVWLEYKCAEAFFLAKEAWRLPPGKTVFPIAPHAWISIPKGSLLSTFSTQDLLRDGILRLALECFHEIILNCVASAMKTAEDSDLKRIRSRKKTDTSALSGALLNLESVLDESVEVADSGHFTKNALIAVSVMVARVNGIKIYPFKRSANNLVTLNEISRKSGFKVRKVELRGRWWEKPCGALLAFESAGAEPVALIPSSKGGYEIYDSSDRKKGMVNDRSVAELDCFAFSFYRGFKTGKISFLDLLKVSLRDCKKDFLFLITAGSLQACLGLFLPVMMSIIFDDIIPNANIGYLVQISLALLVCALASLAFQLVRAFAIIRINQKMSVSFNAALWGRLISLPAVFFRKFTSGDLAMRGLDVFVMQEKISSFFVNVILASAFSLFYVILLVWYNAQLALLMIAISFLYIILIAFFVNRSLFFERRTYRTEGKIAGRTLEFFTGIEKIKAMAVENRVFAIWGALFSRKKKFTLKSGKIFRTIEVLDYAFPTITLMWLFLWLAGKQFGDMSLGKFVGFIYAFYSFQTILIQIMVSIFSCVSAKPTYERIKPILKTLSEYDQTKVSPGYLKGEIEVKGLSFRYVENSPLVLKEVSLCAKPGEFIAFVGPSGSGKSTLMRCLLGFETPSSGSVYYDKQDLSGLDMQEVRQQIGVVLQASRLIPGDVFTNIAGISNVTVEEAWKVAVAVGLEDELKAMPMGILTTVGSGLENFSGGQRQRILIARAIIKKPRILYFDEATSALDNINESTAYRSIENIQATKIVIAHRLNTIMRADRIYVLEKGEIVQVGNYDELMSQKGLFSKLAKRQLL